ncbi:MAG: SUMF1/EgtB/PvdO family nonheme iron enzyme [Candidatus Methylacidiphilales bacterium]|nr:SUMF1/EgtB/PvdO family nonheme iron enzyme [Candidatus Methylacidiphilales bacterium]
MDHSTGSESPVPRLSLRNKIGPGFQPGMVLVDHIELKEARGSAGYCELWSAYDRTRHRAVLLKVLPKALTAQPASDARIHAEVRRTIPLRHRHIVETFDVHHDNTWTAVATEDVEGEPLSIRLIKQAAGYFEVDRIRPWVGQCCEALIYAHEAVGVVHGDLKLQNILIDEEKGVKVIDFLLDRSLALWAEKEQQTMGAKDTDAYRSPQILSGQVPGVADDVYAFGACLYALLTGHPPFYLGDIRQQVREKVPPSPGQRRTELGRQGKPIPAEWEEVITACLQKDPAKRPESMRRVALRLGFKPGATKVKGKRGPGIGRWLTRDFLINAIIVLAVCLPVAGVGWWYTQSYLPAEKARKEAAVRAVEEARLKKEEEARLKKEAEQALAAEAEARKAREAEAEAAAQLARQREAEEADRKARARGSVQITTQPAGAEITLGSLPTLKSPAEFPAVPVGATTAQIRLKGYDPVDLDLEVREGERSAPPTVVLVRQLGNVQITSKPDKAKVYSGGKSIGITPLALTGLPTGPVTFRIGFKGYDTAEVSGQIQKGRETTFSVTLTPSPGPPFGSDYDNSIGMKMVWVPPLQGWVSRYETTQDDFLRVMRADPSQFKGPRKPVENVSWKDAQEFCRRLTTAEARSGQLPATLRYRLPTEKEWEAYAANTGLADAVSVFNDPQTRSPREVGAGMPNAFGLYDVRGNVAEWCQDLYAGKADLRVLRGGSWVSSLKESLALDAQDYSGLNERSNSRGFRCVLLYDEP